MYFNQYDKWNDIAFFLFRVYTSKCLTAWQFPNIGVSLKVF